MYNYKDNITVTTTPNGDKVVTMNRSIFTTILNHLYDAYELQKNKGYTSTAEDTKELWITLNVKDVASEK